MRAIIVVTVLLFGFNSNAQKVDCSAQTKQYQSFLEVNNLEEAFSPWEFVKVNCPQQSERVYLDGVKIIQYSIDRANEDDKEKLIRSLLNLYDQYHKNFPESTQDFEVRKGMALLENNLDSPDEIYQLLDRGFSNALAKVTSGNAIYQYFKLMTEKKQNGDKTISGDKIIEQYTLLSNQIKALNNSNPSERETYVAAERAINALAKDFLNCENLIAYYQSKETQNQENKNWLKSALTILQDHCAATPLFYPLAQKNYDLKVSSTSAYFLAISTLKNRKFEDAKKLFIESAELEENSIEKAAKYYSLATGLYSNDQSKAKEFLLKSIESNPKMGQSYIFLAEMYASSAATCGTTEFEIKAIYYLAIETIKKAAIVQPILETNVAQFIKNNSKNSLSAKDISAAKMNGKTISIGCWINEKITLPSR